MFGQGLSTDRFYPVNLVLTAQGELRWVEGFSVYSAASFCSWALGRSGGTTQYYTLSRYLFHRIPRGPEGAKTGLTRPGYSHGKASVRLIPPSLPPRAGVLTRWSGT